MKKIYSLFLFLVLCYFANAQATLRGTVVDNKNGETIIGGNVLVKGTVKEGSSTDYDGNFEIKTSKSTPLTLVVSYIGYVTKEIEVTNTRDRISIRLDEDTKTLAEVTVKTSRVSEKAKESPLTVESLDAIAIKQAATSNFYEALGSQKGVDLTTASIGFTIINTRGFNSTSPVRSLQIIDGVDNQSPGLNFSLGNFLGSSELDVNKVDLVVGASSAFYGPNAFNGVISMNTKNPFFNKGLSVSTKVGERQLREVAMRYANSIKNKNGKDFFAYKMNLSYMQAYDWVADNYDPVSGTRTNTSNPGGYDAVNTYGDDYNPAFNFGSINSTKYVGVGIFHRRGYKEIDLVDYNTNNLKANVGLHFRLNPDKSAESPELIIGSSFSKGTTVYQGDNRFSLKNILFYQNKIELKKADNYFIRFYATSEDAGDSYDPYFTALLLQQKNKTNIGWQADYISYWQNVVEKRMYASGYPKGTAVYDDNTGTFIVKFDQAAADKWLADNYSKLFGWHAETAKYADTFIGTNGGKGGFLPGTPEFDAEFKRLTSTVSNKREVNGGTRFFDRSALYHLHGEKKWTTTSIDEFTVGANMRNYRPDSQGSIFYDTAGTSISVLEYGIYGGLEKKFMNNRLKSNLTLRMDKNQNFNYLFSPAASLVYTPKANNYLRLSFSSAIRNPTLGDQYLYLNVGPAILSGNLNGIKDVYDVKDFIGFLSGRDLALFESKKFDVAKIKPEKVKTMELGYRTTLFESLYLDLGYYFSLYNDFIGYRICVETEIDKTTYFPTKTQVYRFATNSTNVVTTQGFSAGFNYFFKQNYALTGNYSWNKLNKEFSDDPIIPAFNTPEHKYNIGFSGRDITFGKTTKNKFGFNANYKWIKGFTFEGSPQFTGLIPSYDLLDAQVNYRIDKWKTTFKLGASNVLNNKVFQAYGGPRIGRMAYFTILYDFVKN